MTIFRAKSVLVPNKRVQVSCESSFYSILPASIRAFFAGFCLPMVLPGMPLNSMRGKPYHRWNLIAHFG